MVDQEERGLAKREDGDSLQSSMGDIVDLFGMYGARSDDDLTQSADPPVTSERAEAARSDVVTTRQDNGSGPSRSNESHQSQPATPSSERVENPDWPATDSDMSASPAPKDRRIVTGFNPAVNGSALVRPYIRTGGRTEANLPLALEALIVTNGSAAPAGGHQKREYAFICSLCAAPHSVAEISAHTRLPINTARVIVADMIGIGLLRPCQDDSEDRYPSFHLMQRVLAGLQRL